MAADAGDSTDEKYEISKDEEHNPIKQDVKDGKLRCAMHCIMSLGSFKRLAFSSTVRCRSITVQFRGPGRVLTIASRGWLSEV